MSHKFREADISRKKQTKSKSDFLRRLLPDAPPTTYNRVCSTESELAKQSILPNIEAPKTREARRGLPSCSREIVYETSKQVFIPEIGDDDNDDDDSVK